MIRTTRREGLFGLVIRATTTPDAVGDASAAVAADRAEDHELRPSAGVATGRTALVWYAGAAAGVSVGYTLLAVAAVRLAQALVGHAPLTTVSGWGLVGVLAAGGRAVASRHVARAEAALGARVGLSLREEIAESLLARGPSASADSAVGGIVLAVRSVERASVAGVLGVLRAGLMAAPLVVLLLVELPVRAWAAALVFLPFGVWLGRLRRRVRGAERGALDRGAALDAHLDDLLRHLDLFRVHGTHAALQEAARRMGAESAGANVEAAGYRALASSSNEIVAAVGVALFALLVASGLLVVEPARVAPALAVAFLLYRPLRDFGDARAAWLAGEAALLVLEPHRGAARSTTNEPTAPAAALSPAVVAGSGAGSDTASEGDETGRGRVRLEAFGAARRTERWTFEVPSGAIVAVVGAIGSGKTTLFRALLGLEASVGRLVVEEKEWQTVRAGQRPIAWAPQEAPLVAGSLRRNLALGGPDVDRAAALLGELAPGVGESLDRGTPLSGGERALLAIARAAASGRPLVLLDEPAAHLDAEARDRVKRAIRALREDGTRTVLVISHDADFVAGLLDPARGDLRILVPGSGASER